MANRRCGQEPGLYDWYCQHSSRWHRGPHRYNNYTWARGAKQWATLRLLALRLRYWITRQPPWRRPFARTATSYAPLDNADPWWSERAQNRQPGGPQ